MIQNRCTTSIHEAGHAVVFAHLGVSVMAIRVGTRLRGGLAGYCNPYPGSDKRPIIQCLMTTFAGVMAENIVLGTRTRVNGNDLASLEAYLKDQAPEARERWTRLARSRVRYVLRRDRRAVTRLADYLYRHGEVKGDARMRRVMSMRVPR